MMLSNVRDNINLPDNYYTTYDSDKRRMVITKENDNRKIFVEKETDTIKIILQLGSKSVGIRVFSEKEAVESIQNFKSFL